MWTVSQWCWHQMTLIDQGMPLSQHTSIALLSQHNRALGDAVIVALTADTRMLCKGGPSVDGVSAVHGRARQRDSLVGQADVLSHIQERRMRSGDDGSMIQRGQLVHRLCYAIDRQRMQATGGSQLPRGCTGAEKGALLAVSGFAAARPALRRMRAWHVQTAGVMQPAVELHVSADAWPGLRCPRPKIRRRNGLHAVGLSEHRRSIRDCLREGSSRPLERTHPG